MEIYGSDFGKAVTPLLHKQAPGLVHGMLAASLAITPCEFSLNLCYGKKVVS